MALTDIKHWQQKVRDPWTKAVEDPVTACMNLLDRALYWQLEGMPKTQEAFRILATEVDTAEDVALGVGFYLTLSPKYSSHIALWLRIMQRGHYHVSTSQVPKPNPCLVPEESGQASFWVQYRELEREHEEEYRAKGETAELVREGWWLRFLR